MSFYKSRVKALEARQRRQHRPGSEHFTPVVHVPPDIPSHQWGEWLRAQPCACGVTHCPSPERRIGLLLPTRAETPEEWASRYRPNFDDVELTIILQPLEGAP